MTRRACPACGRKSPRCRPGLLLQFPGSQRPQWACTQRTRASFVQPVRAGCHRYPQGCRCMGLEQHGARVCRPASMRNHSPPALRIPRSNRALVGAGRASVATAMRLLIQQDDGMSSTAWAESSRSTPPRRSAAVRRFGLGSGCVPFLAEYAAGAAAPNCLTALNGQFSGPAPATDRLA